MASRVSLPGVLHSGQNGHVQTLHTCIRAINFHTLSCLVQHKLYAMLQNLTLHPQRDGSLLPGDDTVVVLTIERRNTRYFKIKASAAPLYRIAVRTWWSSGTQPMRGRQSFDIAVWLQNMFFPCTIVLRRIIPRTLDAPILLFICTLFDGCAAIPSHLNLYSAIKNVKT
jgi:hypothetical protein